MGLRRRLVLLCLSVVACIFLFREHLSLPTQLKDVDAILSRANVAYLTKQSTVPEIYGLIHLLTSPDASQLQLNESNSKGELGMELYSSKPVKWNKVRSDVDAKWPVVVFSKTYCPYSKRAKDLLSRYNLDPAIKVIEVDLREDQHHIKSTLGRLTGRSTFPNIIVKGGSIGGSDDIATAHASGELRKKLEEAGIVVRGDGV